MKNEQIYSVYKPCESIFCPFVSFKVNAKKKQHTGKAPNTKNGSVKWKRRSPLDIQGAIPPPN